MEPRNFFAALFDLSFNELLTIRIIKILYVLAILASAFGALVILASGMASRDVATTLGSLILAPVVFVIYVLLARIGLEVIILLFKISENTGKLAGQAEAPGTGTSSAQSSV